MTKSRSDQLPQKLWRRLRRLRALPEIRSLVRIARREGARVWLVGGAVRDAALGRRVLDVDATVSRHLDRIAAALESEGLGRAVPLSDENPRAIRIAGRRDLDLVEADGGSIERDLARRDFTVNALALDLESGQLLDPAGGVADLRRGVLRLLSEENLVDDPLRGFRAARFLATHGLRPDGPTGRACRRHAKALSQVAPERVMVELRRILESPRAAEALRWAAARGLLSPALRLGGAGPPRGLAARLKTLDRMAVRRRPPERRGRLRLALLADALGYSPARAGAWLRDLRFGRDAAGEVMRLLELGRAAREARSGDAAWRWVRDAGVSWRDALLVAVGRAGRESRQARRLAKRARRARRLVRVRGGDVLRWTGLSEGPRVGQLLAELEVETVRGRIRTRPEAKAWLQEVMRREG